MRARLYPYEQYILITSRYYGVSACVDVGPVGVVPAWIVHEFNEYRCVRDFINLYCATNNISESLFNTMLSFSKDKPREGINPNLVNKSLEVRQLVADICNRFEADEELWTSKWNISKKGYRYLRTNLKRMFDFFSVSPDVKWREKKEKEAAPNLLTVLESFDLAIEFFKNEDNKDVIWKNHRFYYKEKEMRYLTNNQAVKIYSIEDKYGLIVDRTNGRIVNCNCDTDNESDVSEDDPLFAEAKDRQIRYARELHGEDYPPLRDLVSETPDKYKDIIVSYLQTGTILFCPGIIKDVLEPSVTIAAGHVLTDGLHWWTDELPAYVRKYNIRIPDDFRNYILSHWRERVKNRLLLSFVNHIIIVIKGNNGFECKFSIYKDGCFTYLELSI